MARGNFDVDESITRKNSQQWLRSNSHCVVIKLQVLHVHAWRRGFEESPMRYLRTQVPLVEA